MDESMDLTKERTDGWMDELTDRGMDEQTEYWRRSNRQLIFIGTICVVREIICV